MYIITHDRNALADLSVELASEHDTRYRRLNDRWEVLEKQHQELERILSVALVSSPYYRRVAAQKDLSPRHGLAAFQGLPLLRRSLYSANLEEIRVAARHLCYRDLTSGTSGSPIEVFRDSRSLFLESRRFADILKYYLGDIAGRGSGRLTVLYVSHYLTSSEHVYQDPVLGACILKLRCDRTNVCDRAKSLGFKLQPGSYVLTGTVSSLLHLATCETARLGLPLPAAVLPSGEDFHSSARRILEETFRAPIFELYTLRECGTIAFQCRRGKGLHIQADWFLVEVLDCQERSVPDGGTGELVVTDLTNYHVPLLRYTTGDFGAVQWARCVCGLSLPVLSGLSGRTPVHFVAAEGRLVDTAVFAKRLERLPILWYRVTQDPNGDVIMEYCAPVEDLSDGFGDICQSLKDTLELARPVTVKSVTLEEAVQRGKTGGFISRL
ncbi:MAG: hypothetical protein ABSD75_34140 [Terriglobales bacterium]